MSEDLLMDENLTNAFADVVRRNQGEDEFLQAVREVLASIGPVLRKHPGLAEHKTIERICEPERQIIFRVPWVDDAGEIQITEGSGCSSTPPSAPTREACASTRR